MIYKHISSNAIGCYQIWNGKYWNGILPQNAKLLLCSDLLPNTPDIKEALKQSTANDSHKDTAALLLRQILEKAEQLPCAVIDIY